MAKEAKDGMKEMQDILKKLGTGTATREEKVKLKSLNAKMSRMKSHFEKSETLSRGPDLELESLRTESEKKAAELLLSFKKKQAREVIRAVCAAPS